jgi:hypothetical protein
MVEQTDNKWHEELIALQLDPEIVEAIERIWTIGQRIICALRGDPQGNTDVKRQGFTDLECEDRQGVLGRQAYHNYINLVKRMHNVVLLLGKSTEEHGRAEMEMAKWLTECQIMFVRECVTSREASDGTEASLLVLSEVIKRKGLEYDKLQEAMVIENHWWHRTYVNERKEKIDQLIIGIARIYLEMQFNRKAIASERLRKVL